MKTLEDLLGDRDAIAAVQTLLAHGFGPDVIAEAAHRFIAHGVRRGAAIVRECAPDAEPSEFCEREHSWGRA